MATTNATLERLRDLYGGDRDWEARKMFGEFAIYLDGKLVGLVCDDRLFVKPLEAARSVLGSAATLSPPYPGAKDHLVPSEAYLARPGALDALVESLWHALPTPKPKASKPGKASR